MKIEYVDKCKVPLPKKRGARPGPVMNIINTFLDSGNEASRVVWEGHYKSVMSAACSIRERVSRTKSPIMVIIRGEELYLVRKENA